MLTRINAAVVSRVHLLHDDESGDVVQSIAIGAVGVLLAAVIFQSMSSVVKDTSSSGMTGIFKGFLGKLGSSAMSAIGL
jgi:hypothetical protein